MVAVKVLHGQYAQDRTRRERFFRGARHMARLRHPGIVRVIEQKCEDGGYHFFVMEYVGGGDLRQEVKAGRLSMEERLRVILESGPRVWSSDGGRSRRKRNSGLPTAVGVAENGILVFRRRSEPPKTEFWSSDGGWSRRKRNSGLPTAVGSAE